MSQEIEKQLEAKLNDVSAFIRATEQRLQKANCYIAPAKHGSLDWYMETTGTWRIYLLDRPLIEAPVKQRLAAVTDIDGLIDAMLVEAKKLILPAHEVSKQLASTLLKEPA